MHHIKGKQKKYIESCLGSYPVSEVREKSYQRLEDLFDLRTMILDFMVDIYTKCNESFNATSEPWELACHCLNELFKKELKIYLSHSLTPDILISCESMIDVLHTSFALNAKVQDLLPVGLKNHPSITISHAGVVMKMSKASKKICNKMLILRSEYNALVADHDRGASIQDHPR